MRMRDDAGETLIESVIAVFMLSIAVVAVMTAAEDGVLASSAHRQVVTSDVQLKTALEQVKALDYVRNATKKDYDVVPNAKVISVTCLPSDSATVTVDASVPTDCTNDTGLQLVTVQVPGSGGTPDSASVVKRRQR